MAATPQILSRFDMTVPSVHCEARKVSYRQTKDGLVVSFVIHPNDMPDALAVAPLGQRYMLALAAIGDDEQPIQSSLPPAERPGVETGSSPTARARASEMGKERYRNGSEADKAISRAAILCGDPKFRIWLAGADIPVTDAAQMIREACGVGSRREFDGNPEALRKFQAIDTEYRIASGQLPEPR